MTADEQPVSLSTEVYRGFLEAVNRQDLDEAERFVDVDTYRENCVGFTRGFVDWGEAKKSIRKVWKGLPDLHKGTGDYVTLRLQVRSCESGPGSCQEAR